MVVKQSCLEAIVRLKFFGILFFINCISCSSLSQQCYNHVRLYFTEWERSVHNIRSLICVGGCCITIKSNAQGQRNATIAGIPMVRSTISITCFSGTWEGYTIHSDHKVCFRILLLTMTIKISGDAMNGQWS
jgi:hypothetical protein